MQIKDVIIPIIADDYAATVAYYRDRLGLPLKAEFTHEGFVLSWLGPIVVLGAIRGADDESALAVPRQVQGIFVVDDLDAFWTALRPTSSVLVPPSDVPSGRRFILRHPDGRAIEYLQLASR